MVHITYLDIEGSIIHYKWLDSNVSNKKNVLVLIHGFGLDLHSWNPILPLLEKNYQILLIQQKIVDNSNKKYNYLTELNYEMQNELAARMERMERPVNQITIRMLNRFEVFVNGHPVVHGWGKRKAKVIFTYLILQKSVTRDELCDVFWPNLPLTNAKNQLKVSLHHLKKILEPVLLNQDEPILITEREHVAL